MKYYYYKFWLTSSRGTDELTIKVYEEPQDADNLMYDCKEWASHFGAWTASENMVRYGCEEIKHIPETLKEMFKIIDSSEEPKIKIGSFCNNPYECALKGQCWGFLPENSVFDLYYGGKKSQELLEEGIIAIKDIPEDFKLNDKQKVQYLCEKTKKPHINNKAIEKFIKTLKYPLYFLAVL